MAEKNSEIRNLIEQLKELSSQDFKNFGLHQIAYIRSKTENNKKIYAIYSADGN